MAEAQTTTLVVSKGYAHMDNLTAFVLSLPKAQQVILCARILEEANAANPEVNKALALYMYSGK